MKKYLAIAITLILLFIASFFIWHFLLSIYEVKFEALVNTSVIKPGSKLTIKTIGINSFGWELRFRTIKSKVEIIEGKDLIKLSQIGNSIIIKILDKEGNFTVKIFPNLSLNPTEFKFHIEK